MAAYLQQGSHELSAGFGRVQPESSKNPFISAVYATRLKTILLSTGEDRNYSRHYGV
jgi:hypothetical protein